MYNDNYSNANVNENLNLAANVFAAQKQIEPLNEIVESITKGTKEPCQ